MKYWDIIKNLDIFSVPFTPAISDTQQFYHKSILGGIVSVIIITLSGAYAFTQILSWNNYYFLPKVTQQYQVLTEEEKTKNYSININVRNVGYDENGLDPLDPFDPHSIILLPIISPDVQDYYTTENYEKYYKDASLNLSLTIKNETQPVVTFILCDQQYLEEGQACASQEVVDQFYNQIGNQLFMEVLFTIINPNNFEDNILRRTYSIIIEKQFCTTDTLFLQLSKYDIDQGSFYSTSQTEYRYTDSTDQSQISSAQYCDRLFLPNTVGVLWLLSQDQIKVEKMVYPKIGEVLANIGSLVSIIFMVKYLARFLNFWNMKQEILQFLSQMYFPELKLLTFQKKWYHIRTQKIMFRGKEIDKKSYKHFIETIHKTIASKLNFMNLLYEISRIQIILHSLQDRQTMIKSHNVGIKLQLVAQEQSAAMKIMDCQTQFKDLFKGGLQESQFPQSPKALQIQDAFLLGLKSKDDQIIIEDKPLEEIEDFYGINVIQSQRLNS